MTFIYVPLTGGMPEMLMSKTVMSGLEKRGTGLPDMEHKLGNVGHFNKIGVCR